MVFEGKWSGGREEGVGWEREEGFVSRRSRGGFVLYLLAGQEEVEWIGRMEHSTNGDNGGGDGDPTTWREDMKDDTRRRISQHVFEKLNLYYPAQGDQVRQSAS